MLNTSMECCCATAATPVNVLFVDCEPGVADTLSQRLLDKQIGWETVTTAALREYLERGTSVGAAVFGKHVCSQTDPDTLSELLKTLEKQGIAAFFLTYGPPATNGGHLVAIIAPETEHELPARLETAVLYARQRHREPSGDSLLEDAAEQLEMAGQVQRNFLPSRLPHTDRIRWAAMFRPAQWVSGDIYDITRLDETHIGFYLADAVGHSMPAALLTIFLKQATVMRETKGHTYRIFEPDAVVAGLNQRMAQQEFSGCLFATCCYGLLNTETLELRTARAGHPYPILIRDHRPQCLQSRGGLLGVFSGAQFEKQSYRLQPGDKLFLYSDGGEPLIGKPADDGTLCFSDAFLSILSLPIEKMMEAYEAMARQHRFGPGEKDDITAIGLEIHH